MNRRAHSGGGSKRAAETVIRELSVALVGATSVDEVLRAALDAARQLVPLKKAALLLVDEQTQELVTRAAMGVTHAEGRWVGKVGKGVTGHVAKFGVPRYVPDVSAAPDYVAVEGKVRSELALPLTYEGHTLGVLDILSTRKKAFTKAHQRLLADIAVQAAAAVVAKRRQEQSDLLSRTARIIANEPGGFPSRLRKIVELIPAGMCAGACSIFLEDADRHTLVLEATTGLDEARDGPIEYSLGEGVTGWVWANAKPLRVVDLADAKELKRIDERLAWRNKYSEALDTHAPRKQFLAAPLIASGRCIGVLRVSRKLDGTNFTSDDEQLAVTIAQQLADAISVRRYHPSRSGTLSRIRAESPIPFSVRKSQGSSRRAEDVEGFQINRYCILCTKVCDQEVRLHNLPSAFMAYPFHEGYPSLMKKVKEGLAKKEYEAVLPVDSESAIPDQGILFCKLCDRIYGTDMVLAETTDLNRNVMFEAGYAVGLLKRLYLLVNSTRIRSGESRLLKDWETLHYQSSAEILARFQADDKASRGSLSPALSQFANLITSPGEEMKPRSAYCLLPNDPSHETDIRDVICETLQELDIEIIPRQGLGHRLHSEWQAIAKAEFVVGDWVSDKTLEYDAKNADCAFLLGLTMARGKKLIILQQRPVTKRMIDMSGVIAEYDEHDDISQILRDKLGSESLQRTIRPEDDVASLVKRELTTYRIHRRLMSAENFSFVYRHQELIKPNAEELAFLELCANYHGYPKWGCRQTKFF